MLHSFLKFKHSDTEFIIFPPFMCFSFPINGTKSNPQGPDSSFFLPKGDRTCQESTSLCQTEGLKHKSIKRLLIHQFQSNPLRQGYNALVWPSTILTVLNLPPFPTRIQVMSMSMLLTLDLSLTITSLNCHGFSFIIFASWKVIHLPPTLGKIMSHFKTTVCS